MQHTNLSQCNLRRDEVDVNLDMLCATMIDRVDLHIDRVHVVTVDDRGQGPRCDALEEAIVASNTQL